MRDSGGGNHVPEAVVPSSYIILPHAGNMGPLERYMSNLIMSGCRVQADSIIVMIFVIGGYEHGRRYDGEDRDGFPSFLERYFWAPRFL
ncbi:hypothetical protein H4I96_10131 [Botrytis cinerea]